MWHDPARGDRSTAIARFANTGPTASVLPLTGLQGSFTPGGRGRLAMLRAKPPVEEPSRDRRPSYAKRCFAISRMKTELSGIGSAPFG